ncbi:GMC family oxidoreductase [Rhodococcus sp. NPDC003348]
MAEEYDYLIVGLGVAGALAAARLTEDPDVRVLALEAGPEFPDDTLPGNEAVRVPALAHTLWGGPLDWNFTTAPQGGLDGRAVPWPRGRVVGGSSAVNVQAWVRGHRADYDSWETHADGWNNDAALAAFRAIEDSAHGAAPWRGVGGPLPIERREHSEPRAELLIRAAEESGFPRTDVNGPDPEGVDLGHSTTRRARRVSFADAYLDEKVRARTNLTVRTGVRVDRVLFDGTRAVGVAATVGAQSTVLAADTVLLAAGAIGTPHLLLLSGIGPTGDLARWGIDVVADLPGVGANLHDHLVVWTGAYLADGQASAATAETHRRALAQWRADGTGSLATTGSIGFARSRTGLAAPDLEFILTTSVTGYAGRRVDGFGVGWVLLQPDSRGSISLASADPADAPRIDPGYLTDPDAGDLATLVRGFRIARRLVDSDALRGTVGEPVHPGFRGDATDVEVAEFVRAHASTIFHPVGTARIGRDGDPAAVLTGDLRVRGVDGLRVLDASAIPTVTRGHTMAPTAVIAHRGIDLLQGRNTRREEAFA